MHSQKHAFISYEANEWFKRNKSKLLHYRPEDDNINSLINSYNLNPATILEIGCSAGYRLNALHQQYPLSNVVGVEPSEDAIAFGKQNYPAVSFIKTTADQMDMLSDKCFDLIIVGFVFYVVDRALLFRTVSEIDRLLKDNGHLIILDFSGELQTKNNYQHISDFQAYSYKQNYYELFTTSGMYHLMDKSTFNHDTMKLDAANNFDELVSLTMLKKMIHAGYK